MEPEYVVGENKYGKYAIPKSTLEIETMSREILAGGYNEPETVDFMLANCCSGSIIHAGAFFGDMLPALGGTGQFVLAFEPVFESFWCAKKTVELTFGKDHDIHLFNYGLGEKAETLQIKTKDIQGRSMGGRPKYDFGGDVLPDDMVEETTVVTLDSMVISERRSLSEFTLLHLDVEEHEEAALKGAIQILIKSKPTLILECWSDRIFNTQFFQEIIFPLGYERVISLPNDNEVLQIL